jgi:hypothetical protein
MFRLLLHWPIAYLTFSDISVEQLQAGFANHRRNTQTSCTDDEGPWDFKYFSLRDMDSGGTDLPAGVEEGARGGDAADGLLPEAGESVGKRASVQHLLRFTAILTSPSDLI